RLYTARHSDGEFAIDLLFGEFLARRQLGEEPCLDEYRRRFPDLAEQLAVQVRLSDALAPSSCPATVPPKTEIDHAAPDHSTALNAPLGRLGRYELREEIGRGGMGLVLLGHDPILEREVAVKVLMPAFRNDPAVVHRFTEEAQIGGQLQHPGIVPVYEVG